MLERLTVGSISLPTLYVARDDADIKLAKDNGLPYIVWHEDMDTLIKVVLYPTLHKLFPHIMWEKVLGIGKRRMENLLVEGGKVNYGSVKREMKHLTAGESDIADMAVDWREFDGGYDDISIYDEDMTDCYHYQQRSIMDYVGDMSAYVNLEELQKLNLLPQFMGDIEECIRRNIYAQNWIDGYNKKLGYFAGNYNAGYQKPNLIILDISGSIPRGIAATMISLIDTLRHQAEADLIITADISKFYPADSPLPSPDDIRNTFSIGNESYMFYRILAEQCAGKEYGNIISFGDFDCPDRDWCWRNNMRSKLKSENRDIVDEDMKLKPKIMAGFSVDKIWHYHTKELRQTGYARWAKELCPSAEEEFNTDWCSVMETCRGRW